MRACPVLPRIACLVAVLVPGAVFAVAPSATLSNPTAAPTSGEVAICDADPDGTVDVSVDAVFDHVTSVNGAEGAYSACTGCGIGPLVGHATCPNASSNRYRYSSETDIAVTPGAVSVQANLTPLALGVGSTYAGAIAAAVTDGSQTVDFTASFTDTVVTTTTERFRIFANAGACTAGTTYTTPANKVTVVTTYPVGVQDAPTSASYLVDVEPPTVVHDLVGEPVSVTQQGTVNYNITAKKGSAETDFSLQALASLPPDVASDPLSGLTFGAAANGIAADETEAVGLTLNCQPTGSYTTDALLAAVDLCGDAWGDVQSSDDAGFTLPTFEVTEDDDCAGLEVDTVLSAPLESDNYEFAECFTSAGKGRGGAKTVANPGTVHVGTVVLLPVGDGSCAETVSGIELTLTKPATFNWAMSGSSPATHVFLGLDTGSYSPHYGTPLSEYTGALLAAGAIVGGTDNSDPDIVIDLSGLDVGCGAGEIPEGWMVYARAHVRFKGPSGVDVEHEFSSSAIADDLLGTFSDATSLFENPTAPVCLNGVFDE